MSTGPISVAIVSDRSFAVDAASAILQSCGISDITECTSWVELPDVSRRKRLHAIFADNELTESAPSSLSDENVVWFATPPAVTERLADSLLLTNEPAEKWRKRLQRLLDSSHPTHGQRAERDPSRKATLLLKLRGGGTKLISGDEIVYAHAATHGSDIHLEDGASIPCYQSLPEVERSLGKKRRSFVRCTRILVNLCYVAGITVARHRSAVHFTMGGSLAVGREDARLLSALVTKHWRSTRIKPSRLTDLREMSEPIL